VEEMFPYALLVSAFIYRNADAKKNAVDSSDYTGESAYPVTHDLAVDWSWLIYSSSDDFSEEDTGEYSYSETRLEWDSGSDLETSELDSDDDDDDAYSGTLDWPFFHHLDVEYSSETSSGGDSSDTTESDTSHYSEEMLIIVNPFKETRSHADSEEYAEMDSYSDSDSHASFYSETIIYL
jgi:hypothetical protein